MLAAGILLSTGAGVSAQTSKSTAAGRATPPAMAKIYKRPLLRTGRIQYCLKEQGLYEGRLNGRMTAGTLRALRQLRDDLRIKADSVAVDWALHALLWRQCRERWVAAGGAVDRFGFAIATGAGPATKVANQAPRGSADAAPVAVAEPPALCLPQDLRELLSSGGVPRPGIGLCELPCLDMPPELDRDDAAAYQRRLGFSWCKSCVPYGGQLGTDDIARIEKAGNLTLCPDPRRMLRFKPKPRAVLSPIPCGERGHCSGAT